MTRILPRLPRTLGLTATALLLANTALAETLLPAPYISRALDAVLLPIDANVVDMFALRPDDFGVLVLAVQPGGIAEANGILPGDVISYLSGYTIYEPIDIDTIVYYWISTGSYDFYFDVYRGSEFYTYDYVISSESYYEVIEVSSVESWSSYSYESFSYSEYYAEYASEMTESYEYSESYIEETVSSEEWVAAFEEETEALTSEEAMSDEEMTEEEMAEEAMAEEEMAEEEMAEEEMAEEEMAEEEAVEEEAMDEEPMEEEMAEEPMEEEPMEEEAAEEPVEEDSGGDE